VQRSITQKLVPGVASIVSAKFVNAGPSLWNRIRLQLGGGLLLAVLLPWAVRVQIEAAELGYESLQQSVIGTAVAVVLGYYGFRRLTLYPGARAGYHIVPVFSVAYAAVLAVFFFARLEYSRLHFLASYLVCLLWYFAVYMKLQRGRRLRIGVLPGGKVDHLFSIKEVDWVRLQQASHSDGFDAIVADLRADLPGEWERFLADCAVRGLLVMHVKQVAESLTGRVEIEHLSENTLGSLIPGIGYSKIKRVGDTALALLLLPVLIVLFIPVAILIKADSRGPVFFRQERMGYRGRPFTMWKLRTMHVQSGIDDARRAAMTRDNDDRVTRVGRILRQYRIDELPQVLNIIKGEMSWIGPRPEAVPLSLWYEEELPFYRYRHIVRPGITGWAQVSQGHVAEVDEVLGKLHYDFYYIKNFSFWLDVLVAARTLRTIVFGFGAR
jgi:lipopolysaccharide/colanic/teichoic acid biosynthesis glycosyltransferase